MNKSTASVIKNLSGQLQKIYAAVPISSPWSIDEIIRECHRTGCRVDRDVMLRCLHVLDERKLIKQHDSLTFQKMDLSPTVKKPQLTQQDTSMKQDVKAEKPKGPMELLSSLAQKARSFANELDNAALEIEQDFQANQQQTKKLRQLQSLLKDIAE